MCLGHGLCRVSKEAGQWTLGHLLKDCHLCWIHHEQAPVLPPGCGTTWTSPPGRPSMPGWAHNHHTTSPSEAPWPADHKSAHGVPPARVGSELQLRPKPQLHNAAPLTLCTGLVMEPEMPPMLLHRRNAQSCFYDVRSLLSDDIFNFIGLLFSPPKFSDFPE